MTALTDFDRLLGDVLEADGPQSAPATLVDGALLLTRTMGQRRPVVAVLDGRAWPRRGPAPIDLRRAATVALVALLALAIIAAMAIVGRRPPAVLSAGERAFVYADGMAHVVTADGHAAYARNTRRTGCPVLVPGTSSLVSMSFASYAAQEVTTGDVTARIPIGAGWEDWSPSRRTLALYDTDARRLNVVDFSDGARASGWFAVTGLAGIAWSVTGDEVLLLRTTARGVEVDRYAVGTQRLTSAVAVIPMLRPGASVALELGPWSPDERTLVIVDDPGSGPVVRLVDLASGQETTWTPRARVVIGPWAPDSSVIVITDPDGTITLLGRDGRVLPGPAIGPTRSQPEWSPSGRDLAFRDAAGLTVVARDGTRRRSLVLDRTAAFAWAGDDALLVAHTVAAGSISLTRYAAADLSAIAQTTSASSLADSAIPDPNQLCLQFGAASAGS
jgi:hypothetical protein